MEIAHAWQTAPAGWWDATDTELATALDILEIAAQQAPPAPGG